jgi:ADP-heptose:LPS heptosyltransferase/predicted SAM-dependent methyltransferase
MTWRATDPQGDEAGKVRLDLIPYLGGTGLDIGCGPKKVFPHFMGLDSGKDIALFGIEMKPDIVGDCVKIPLFADESFDTVFSSHTLEHIEDYRAALREWWRLVKVGGYLILYLPHKDHYPNIGQPGGNADHKHDFVPQDIIDAMRATDGWELLVNETRAERREYSFLQVFKKTGVAGQRLASWTQPKPTKTAGVVRPGALGDALWASAVCAGLKAEGYHVTLYTGANGEEVLKHDPNVDRIINLGHIPDGMFTDDEWLLFYLWETQKYTRFANLIGVAESTLLPHPNELQYFWPLPVRQARMNRNYLEAMHEVALLPTVSQQRFYPSPAEAAWVAERRRVNLPGPLVVVAPTGSGGPKTWPHVQRFMELMAEAGIYTVVLGDLRQDLTPIEPYTCIMGRELPIRLAMALAGAADAVVGTETGIMNAVANEAMLKVVLLSHSTPENLTKHWTNTVALEAKGLACHPCHRLHRAFEFCTKDANTGWAACQAYHSAEAVAALVLPVVTAGREKAA